MKTIQLSDTAHKNLLLFLQRVDLKGSEVPAFAECFNAINNPIPEVVQKTENEQE